VEEVVDDVVVEWACFGELRFFFGFAAGALFVLCLAAVVVVVEDVVVGVVVDVVVAAAAFVVPLELGVLEPHADRASAARPLISANPVRFFKALRLMLFRIRDVTKGRK
jgi:hypothetical protein